MTNMKIECSICVEEYATSAISVCPFCEIKVCKTCVKTYIFDKKSSIIDCMNCKKVWSRSILIDIFTKSFVNGKLNSYIKEILFLEQKTLIPETLPMVEKVKQKNELISQNVKDKELLLTIPRDTIEYYILDSKIKTVLSYIKTHLRLNDILHHNNPTTDKKEYVFPCTNPDCLGHVNSNWNCKICDGVTCKKCHAYIPNKDDYASHVCIKEDIETATLIKKTSKSCPGCNISIIKSEGCDQMWCVKCHVAFSWKTGKIQTSRIHNPEYYRWLRENNGFVPREPDDVPNGPCNNIHNIIYRKCKKIKTKYIYYIVLDIYRLITHIEMVDINTNDNISIRKWYREQRMKLLLETITEKQFKTNIAKKYKESMYNEEKLSLVTTLRDILKDKLAYYFNKDDKEINNMNINTCTEYMNDINTHIQMCNDMLKKTNAIYGYTNKIVYPKLMLKL